MSVSDVNVFEIRATKRGFLADVFLCVALRVIMEPLSTRLKLLLLFLVTIQQRTGESVFHSQTLTDRFTEHTITDRTGLMCNSDRPTDAQWSVNMSYMCITRIPQTGACTLEHGAWMNEWTPHAADLHPVSLQRLARGPLRLIQTPAF